MKFVSSKVGRLALSLAASGSAALFMAGTALADVSVNHVADKGVNVTTNTVTQTTEEVTSTEVVATVGAASTGPSDGTGADGSGSGPTQPPAGHVAGVVSNDLTSPSDADNKTSMVAASVDSNGSADTLTMPLAASTPAVTEAVSLAPVPAAVLYRAQRTLFSSPSASAPLAVTNPAAPVSPANHPTVPQSSGLFTMLAAELAGTVVPKLFQGFYPASLLSVRLIPVATLTLVAIFLSLLIFTYGLALRRSGYSTAARSDVNPFTFATPRLIDYGFSFRLPIVFFGGVRNQSSNYLTTANAYTGRR